jgi:hypothetical protein
LNVDAKTIDTVKRSNTVFVIVSLNCFLEMYKLKKLVVSLLVMGNGMEHGK